MKKTRRKWWWHARFSSVECRIHRWNSDDKRRRKREKIVVGRRENAKRAKGGQRNGKVGNSEGQERNNRKVNHRPDCGRKRRKLKSRAQRLSVIQMMKNVDWWTARLFVFARKVATCRWFQVVSVVWLLKWRHWTRHISMTKPFPSRDRRPRNEPQCWLWQIWKNFMVGMFQAASRRWPCFVEQILKCFLAPKLSDDLKVLGGGCGRPDDIPDDTNMERKSSSGICYRFGPPERFLMILSDFE